MVRVTPKRAIFALALGAAFLLGRRSYVPAYTPLAFSRADCDYQIEAALTDICAECMCREFSTWWCRTKI